MKILSIETSCDETAIAVLDCKGTIKNPSFKILSSVVSSQVKIHAKWGGVVPNLAKREHIKNLPLVFKKALKEAKTKIEKINIVAITTGPGLEPALWTGINFTQELIKKYPKPLVAVNHMEGHLAASLLGKKQNLKFPALALLVSGGHTELVLVKKWLDYKIIGETLDDAAGEAFDKIAKMLGLSYPGGPIVSKLASEHIPDPLLLKQLPKIIFPRPMINSKNYNFSFSGLKTSVLYFVRDAMASVSASVGIPLAGRSARSAKASRAKLTKAICYEAQQAIIETLISKTIRAAKEYGIKSIILGGGVAASEELRRQMGEKIKTELPKVKYILPEVSLTGDNAAMIAAAAYFRALKKQFVNPQTLKAEGNLPLK